MNRGLPSKAMAGRSSGAGSGLDPGLPPEQLLAPARGRTLRQRGCSLSNAMNKNMHVMIMQDLTTLCLKEEELS
jgi:hypothetical protein